MSISGTADALVKYNSLSAAQVGAAMAAVLALQA